MFGRKTGVIFFSFFGWFIACLLDCFRSLVTYTNLTFNEFTEMVCYDVECWELDALIFLYQLVNVSFDAVDYKNSRELCENCLRKISWYIPYFYIDNVHDFVVGRNNWVYCDCVWIWWWSCCCCCFWGFFLGFGCIWDLDFYVFWGAKYEKGAIYLAR